MLRFSEGDSLEEVTNLKLFQGFSVFFKYGSLLLLAEEELLQGPEVVLDQLQGRSDRFLKSADWLLTIEFINPVLKTNVQHNMI